jgi:hypothetical protein
MSRHSLAQTPSAPVKRHAKGGTSWRDLPFQTMQAASKNSGLSTASLYRLSHAGRLTLLRLAGRTMVETSSLIDP